MNTYLTIGIIQALLFITILGNLNLFFNKEMNNIANLKNSRGKKILFQLLYVIIPTMIASFFTDKRTMLLTALINILILICYGILLNQVDKKLKEFEIISTRLKIKVWLSKQDDLKYKCYRDCVEIIDESTERRIFYVIKHYEYINHDNEIRRANVIKKIQRRLNEELGKEEYIIKREIIKNLERI